MRHAIRCVQLSNHQLRGDGRREAILSRSSVYLGIASCVMKMREREAGKLGVTAQIAHLSISTLTYKITIALQYQNYVSRSKEKECVDIVLRYLYFGAPAVFRMKALFLN